MPYSCVGDEGGAPRDRCSGAGFASLTVQVSPAVAPSTMPQMLGATVQDRKRASGAWAARGARDCASLRATHLAMLHAHSIAEGMELDAACMCQNLGRTLGLIVAAAAMMGLAACLGQRRGASTDQARL